MIVEDCCQAVLAEILSSFGKESGYAIEIGCGTLAFYCELFNKLGFKTIAVEPLPIDYVRHLCQYRNITLVESCIGEYDGTIDLYIGSYLGKENLNLNSTRSNWWGSTSTAKKVESMTLKTLIEKLNIDEITCLKIDIEGAEYSVLKQLSSLSSNQIPNVLMFEYGGGSTFEEKQGGWSEEFLQDTLNILSLLHQFGYRQAIKIDSEQGSVEEVLDLNAVEIKAENLFSPKNIYGNIIALYGENKYSEDKIHEICQNYRDNNRKAPSLKFRESLPSRILSMRLKICFYLQKILGYKS